jgi:hypothetical protein
VFIRAFVFTSLTLTALFSQAIQPAKPETARAIQQAQQSAAEVKVTQPVATPSVQTKQPIPPQASQSAPTLVAQASQASPPLNAPTNQGSQSAPAVAVSGSQSAQTSTTNQYACTGPVTQLVMRPDGSVYVSGMGGINWGVLCTVSGTASNGYTADACKAAYAQLLLAEANGQPMTVWFNDNLTCTTQPSWSWLTSLYFGPGKD